MTQEAHPRGSGAHPALFHLEGGALDQQNLATRFAAGEPTALHELYQEHGTLVFSLCMAALRHRQDAEDATQQVFTRAWRFRESYDVTRPTGAWLTGITRRVIADIFASRDRDRQSTAAGVVALARQDNPQPTQTVVDRVVVQQTLTELGPPQDEILRLIYIEDLPLKTVAAQLHMPLGTVKSHVHRGLARMRKSLEVHSDQ